MLNRTHKVLDRVIQTRNKIIYLVIDEEYKPSYLPSYLRLLENRPIRIVTSTSTQFLEYDFQQFISYFLIVF